MDWIREHFALLMLIGVVSLMLIGALSVHFPGSSSQTKTCPDDQPDCRSGVNLEEVSFGYLLVPGDQ